jgi:hypothetical protein
VVDASQGVEAQTLANVYQALENNLEIVPGPEQGRSARRGTRKGQAADRGRDRYRRLGCDADLRQDRHRHSGRAGGDRQPPAGAEGRPQRAAEGPAGRFLVRRLISASSCWCASSMASMKKGDQIRMMRHRRRLHVERVGVFTPKKTEVEGTRARRDRLSHRLDQGSRRYPRRRHHHRRCQEADRRAAAGLQARRSRWCSAACFRSMPRNSRSARGDGQAAAQ